MAPSTVSNILSGHRGAYAEGTKAKVFATARQHGYYPNRLASALRGSATPVVAVLMPNLFEPYFGELLDTLTRVLARRKLEVIVGVPHWRSPLALPKTGSSRPTRPCFASSPEAFRNSFTDR